jgi:hypothetical protein
VAAGQRDAAANQPVQGAFPQSQRQQRTHQVLTQQQHHRQPQHDCQRPPAGKQLTQPRRKPDGAEEGDQQQVSQLQIKLNLTIRQQLHHRHQRADRQPATDRRRDVVTAEQADPLVDPVPQPQRNHRQREGRWRVDQQSSLFHDRSRVGGVRQQGISIYAGTGSRSTLRFPDADGHGMPCPCDARPR